MRKPLAVAAATVVVFVLLVSATASAQHCNVLRRQPDGVPGQNPITMCLNVSSLPEGGGAIEVTWSGSQDPSPRDVIGLYYSSALPPAPSEPIKFIDAARDPNHLSQGSGRATFVVDNLRWPVAAAMTNRRWGREDVRALSPPVSFDRPNEPQQLHVAPAGSGYGSSSDPSTAVVQWVTADARKPRVRYWWTRDGATSDGAVVEATTSTYGRGHMCGGPAGGAGWFEPGSLHRATLTGLPRSTRVFYEVYDEGDGGGDGGGRSTRRGSFFTPPEPTSPSSAGEAEARIVLMADAGTGDPSPSTQSPGWTFSSTRNTSRAVAADLADEGDGGAAPSTFPRPSFRGRLLVHAGDVSYANGHAAQWDAFFEQWRPALERARYAAVVGNHEANWPRGSAWGRYGSASEDSGGECGVPFFARIASPGWDEGTRDASLPPVTNNRDTFDASPWWSLDEGPVHVVGYSTEHDFSPGSAQFEFLERDLSSVDREKTPWVVVVGHRPMYIDSNFSGPAEPAAKGAAKGASPAPASPGPQPPLNSSDVAVSRDLREALEPLFLGCGVDATFHGHHHSWQRTCATDGGGGECVSDAENNDGGGAIARGATAPATVPRRRNATTHFVIGHAGGDFTDGSLRVPTPPLFQSVEFQHGHARLRATRSEMTVEAVRASDGKVFDSVTLRKRAAAAAPPPQSPSSPSSPPPSPSQELVATASAKRSARLLSQRRILLRGEAAAAMAAATVLSG